MNEQGHGHPLCGGASLPELRSGHKMKSSCDHSGLSDGSAKPDLRWLILLQQSQGLVKHLIWTGAWPA